jgi:hypothetical protein
VYILISWLVNHCSQCIQMTLTIITNYLASICLHSMNQIIQPLITMTCSYFIQVSMAHPKFKINWNCTKFILNGYSNDRYGCALLDERSHLVNTWVIKYNIFYRINFINWFMITITTQHSFVKIFYSSYRPGFIPFNWN